MYRGKQLSLVVIGFGLLLTGAVPVYSQEPTTQNSTQTKVMQKQEQEVEHLVKKAENYIKDHGKEKALAEFNKKDGLFTKGNSYVFAIDYKGIKLANPNEPDTIGKNQFDMQDPKDGTYVIRVQIDKAKAGGGWVKYRWTNPITMQLECKKGFVIPMDNDYLIGSGYYYAAGADGKCE